MQLNLYAYLVWRKHSGVEFREYHKPKRGHYNYLKSEQYLKNNIDNFP